MTSPGGPRGRRRRCRREGWGRGAGSGGLALIYCFLRRLAGSRRLGRLPCTQRGWDAPRLAGAGRSGVGFSQPPLRRAGKRRIWRGQGHSWGETWDPAGDGGVGGGGAGRMRSRANSPFFAILVRSSLLFFYSYFRSGFIKWMLQLAAAPPLCCRTAASRAGQVPAPGRWRGAIRRASFDSLSQLPLFNQIIGKVNLLDSCSLQPPPFPRSPQPHALPTRSSARPLHPDAVLQWHTKAKRREFSFLSEGRKAAAGVCQVFPFPLALFYFYFFFFSLFYKFPRLNL